MTVTAHSMHRDFKRPLLFMPRLHYNEGKGEDEVLMKKMRRLVEMLLSALLLCAWTAPCLAADSAFKEVFEDSFYGGLTGVLVGAAVMAFTSKPGDHLEYLGVGGAVGVLGGATYGVVKTTRSLAAVEDGKVKFAMPTVIPNIQDASGRGPSALVIRTEIFRGKF